MLKMYKKDQHDLKGKQESEKIKFKRKELRQLPKDYKPVRLPSEKKPNKMREIFFSS